MVKNMKKLMLSIIVICCLLASSIVSVNALTVQTKKERTMTSLNEQNQIMKKIFNKNDLLDVIKRDDIHYSQGLLPRDLDGNIVPAYFFTWCDNQYYKSEGGQLESIVYDGYLYQSVRMWQENNPDEWMGLLKYNASDGTLCDYEIWTNEVAMATGLVILDNHIYLCGVDLYSGYTALVKYDISGDDLNFVDCFVVTTGAGLPICADENNIYICGQPAGESDSIFLQKYNTDLESVWIEPAIWDGPYEDECWGITVYDGSIFLTGRTMYFVGFIPHCSSFVLKFDSDGNLLEEVIGEDDDQCGTAIKGYEGKIYVAFAHMGSLSELYNVDFKISAYDTDLVNLWASEKYDYSNYDIATSIVFVDDYIYMGGYIWDFDVIHGIDDDKNSFIFKGSISNGEKVWWKIVDADTDAWSISADDNYLYLTGTNFLADSEKAYILKCAFNGNSDPSSPDVPTITGAKRGKTGVEYDYNFVSTINFNDVDIKYFIEWGDGDTIATNFYPPGQKVVVNHTWTEKGSYTVRAKAITIDGYESGWGTLKVTMPRNLVANAFLFKLIEQFPLLQRLLKL